MVKSPDTFDFDRSDRKLYKDDALASEIFTGMQNRDMFLLAMAFGFRKKVRRPLETREHFFQARDLRPEDEVLVDSVAIHDTGSAEVLSDRKAVFKIAEEYAHAGIRLLHDTATSGQPGSFIKKLEYDLFSLLGELDSD